MLSVMKEGDIAKLEAIGGVLTAIGNLITAMQPPPGLMDAIADMAGGSFFRDGDPEGAATLMKTYGDMMGMIMESVKQNIPPMIKEILAIDIGDDPCMAKAKTEVMVKTKKIKKETKKKPSVVEAKRKAKEKNMNPMARCHLCPVVQRRDNLLDRHYPTVH